MSADDLLAAFAEVILANRPQGPVLDLASGDGHNGLFLAAMGVHVILADRSHEALDRENGILGRVRGRVEAWETDFERAGSNPLRENEYSAILVFRYLHRPLVPCIRKALRTKGFLVYETYTVDQRHFGKPHNPDFLLKRGELMDWFKDWNILHAFEGVVDHPRRAVAQLVCRKP